MKKKIYRKRYSGASPRRLGAPTAYAGGAVGPGAISAMEVTDYAVLLKSGISLQGSIPGLFQESIPGLKPFSEMSPRRMPQ